MCYVSMAVASVFLGDKFAPVLSKDLLNLEAPLDNALTTYAYESSFNPSLQIPYGHAHDI